jgi:acetyl esterase/lipase
MLGSSKMINLDQVQDCLNRGWIVLAPNHRLCPQVNLLEGPIQDCRDLLSWIHDGGLAASLKALATDTCLPDLKHVFGFGTSSGGTLALSLVSQTPTHKDYSSRISNSDLTVQN